MAKLRLAALPCMMLIALGGCSEFFEFNAFKGLDPVRTPVASDYEGADGLDQLETDLTSPAVVDAMTDETVDEIEEMLIDEYLDDGVDSEEDQQAAILLADLNLVTSSGDDVVNNFVDTLVDFIGFTEQPSDEEIAGSLSEIIPEEVMASPEAFAELINGFLDANEAYEAFGASLETLPPPTDANLGDVAQKAVVAFIVSSVVDAFVAAGNTEAEAIAILYAIIQDPEGADPALLGNLQPPDISEENPEAFALMNILDAAGLDLESLPGAGGAE